MNVDSVYRVVKFIHLKIPQIIFIILNIILFILHMQLSLFDSLISQLRVNLFSHYLLLSKTIFIIKSSLSKVTMDISSLH